MRKLDIHKRAYKALQSLPPKHGRQVAERLNALCKDPIPPDAKQLHGYTFWRADVGEYRVIYTFTESSLTIIVLGKRNDSAVYKLLQRAMR